MLIVYSIIGLVIAVVAYRISGTPFFEKGMYDGVFFLPKLFTSIIGLEPYSNIHTFIGLYGMGFAYGIWSFIWVVNTIAYHRDDE